MRVTDLFRNQHIEIRRLFDTVLLGVVGAGAALLFGWLLNLCQKLFLVDLAGYVMPPLGNNGSVGTQIIGHHGLWFIPIATTIGGILSGIIVYTFAPEAEGHGTDTVVAAFHRTAGVIRARVAPTKLIASAITIGSGGSAGREGPTALITAGVASIYGGWRKRSEEDRRFLIIVGMAAGLSAVFRSPIGTAIFAIEVLYSSMEFEGSLLIYTMLASVVAYAVNGAFVGFHPMFATPANVQEPGDRAYGWFAVLGVACGLVAAILPSIFYRTRDLFRRIPIPNWIKPGIGGLLVGLLALEWPQILGGGYPWMQLAINGQLVLKITLALVLVKMLALALTVGSGGSGGIFAPSMFVGAMLGSSAAMLTHHQQAGFAVVGMAALFGAAARVPFATLLMVTEMTGGYQLLVPTGLAVMLAVLIQVLLTAKSKYPSMYEAQVPSRAQSAAHYVEDLRSAIATIAARRLAPGTELGTVDVESLLHSGVSLEFGQGHQIFTAVVAKGSPLIGETIGHFTTDLQSQDADVLGAFREAEGMIHTDPSCALKENDRLLLLGPAEIRAALKDKLVFRVSGLTPPPGLQPASTT
jgi:chloride channel protein, CIC family